MTIKIERLIEELDKDRDGNECPKTDPNPY